MKQLNQGVAFLADHGLNLFSILRCTNLPEKILAHFDAADIPTRDFSHLVLVGNGGGRFWEALEAHGRQGPDPVDTFSEQVTRQFIGDYLGSPPTEWLFPSDKLVPLQQLGELANWGHPSPLGVGISPQYGVWFAYRAAFLVSADLPSIVYEPSPSPCDTCIEKPCITVCPASAVGAIGEFDIPACAAYRITPASRCADRCLSRLACPIAAEQRYSLAQIQYHYNLSRTTILKYLRDA